MKDITIPFAPPNDTDAEQVTLAAMLLDAGKYAATVAAILTTEDFYRPTHGIIFDAIRSLAERHVEVDLITLKDELVVRGKLDECGGVEYLMSIMMKLPSASRVKHYANIVKEKSRLRKLIRVGSEIIAMANTTEGIRAEEAEAKATDLLIKAVSEGSNGKFIPMKEAVQQAAAKIEEYATRKGRIVGVRTGLSKIDKMTMGIENELTIVAAATGVGKTAMLLQMARMSKDLPGAFFELEMGAAELAERMIVSQTAIDSYVIRAGLITEDDSARIAYACNELQKMNVQIYDQPINATRLIAMAQQTILEHGTKYILVDYLGLIEPPTGKRSESRNLELGAITRSLQKIARTYKVPVIAACQLSRKWQDRGKDSRPTLRDLRDSGELEQHAYRVIFLHDPNPQEAKSTGEELTIEVDLAKNRGGPVGIQQARIERKTFRFYDVDEHREQEVPSGAYWTE